MNSLRDSADVCILHNSLRTIWVFRRAYINELISMGLKVCCIAPNDDKDAVLRLSELGVTVHAIEANSFLSKIVKMNYAYFKRFGFLRKNNPVVVSHFITTFVMFIPVHLFNSKNIVFIEGIGTFFNKHLYLLRLLKVLVVYISSKRVFMNTRERALLGKKEDSVFDGIGIDLDFFNTNYHTSIGVDSRMCNMLFVGRLVEDKGIRDVFKLLEKLLKEKYPCRLTIVGETYPGNPGSLTTADIASYKEAFPTSVTFVGKVDDLRPFYSNSDLLVLPSAHEGFPVVVMEGNAMGVPAIVYDVPGCQDAVKHRVNGLVVPFGKYDEMAKLVQANSHIPLKASSVNYALLKFDHNIRIKKTVKMISSLM